MIEDDDSWWDDLRENGLVREHRPDPRNREHLQRQREEQDYRTRGTLPTDWSDTARIRAYVEYHMGDDGARFGNGNPLKQQLDTLLRRQDITLEQALLILGHIPWRDKRIFEDCLQAVTHLFWDLTHEQRIAIMNNTRVYSALDQHWRWRIRDAVLEEGDLRKLGVTWTLAGNHLQDTVAHMRFLDTAVTTHALECIQNLGDDSTERADAILFDRLEKGIGPDPESSEKTAEFLAACHALGSEVFAPEEKVELASRMIVMLVGRQSRRDRETGSEAVRIQYTKLRTLNYLLNIIFKEMTDENAGIMLRFAMGRHRHHMWVWNRIMEVVEKRYHWRIAKVQRFPNGKIGVKWMVGNRLIVVVPADGNETIGELEPDKTLVLIPHLRFVGTPIEVEEGQDGYTVYQAPLHPLRPATQAMRDARKA